MFLRRFLNCLFFHERKDKTQIRTDINLHDLISARMQFFTIEYFDN